MTQAQDTTEDRMTPKVEIPRDYWRRTGVRLGRPIDRLPSRCIEVDGCWVYTWQLDRKGYSRIRGAGGSKVFGHRLAYEYFIGGVPDGLTFDHLCRNTSCVNPWHGELVPNEVNVARAESGAAYANSLKTHCPQGHPLDGENIVRSRGRNGSRRSCRICRCEINRRYRLRKKVSA